MICAIDVGLVNLGICVLQRITIDQHPRIVAWYNMNVYKHDNDGKIKRTETISGFIQRIRTALCRFATENNIDWKKMKCISVENQAIANSIIKRAETAIFAFFVYTYPTVPIVSISARRKLSVRGIVHPREHLCTYQKRKQAAVRTARHFLRTSENNDRFENVLDDQSHSDSSATSDLSDALLLALYVLDYRLEPVCKPIPTIPTSVEQCVVIID